MEEKVGTVTDYYAKVGVAAIKLGEGALQVGDRIRIRGHTTDVIQRVESLQVDHRGVQRAERGDRKSTRLNSSHLVISYAVFCLKKKKIELTYQSDMMFLLSRVLT